MSFRLRKLLLPFVLIVLVSAAGSGCSAKQADNDPAVPVAEVTEPGADVAVEPEAEEEPKETCHGALDCTFFGLGAVLAAPFWVLGAFLGLVF